MGSWTSAKDGKLIADGQADSSGTVGKSWSQAELDAQIDRERRIGKYWHPLKGSMDAATFATLLPADKALCLAPIP